MQLGRGKRRAHAKFWSTEVCPPLQTNRNNDTTAKMSEHRAQISEAVRRLAFNYARVFMLSSLKTCFRARQYSIRRPCSLRWHWRVLVLSRRHSCFSIIPCGTMCICLFGRFGSIWTNRRSSLASLLLIFMWPESGTRHNIPFAH